jgi:hypothetical protein
MKSSLSRLPSPAVVASSIGRRVTYANVASTLALAIALGTGTAYAANTVRSHDIVNGQVKSADLAAKAVKSVKIKNGGVKGIDLAAGSVSSTTVADGALTIADLAPGTIPAPAPVGTDQIVDGSVTGTDVANNSITLDDILGANVNGSISLGAGAVANGRCRQFGVLADGAVPGQAVIFSATGPVQDGITLYGSRVPAADTVTLDVCNHSGVAMSAIADLPVHVVTFG